MLVKFLAVQKTISEAFKPSYISKTVCPPEQMYFPITIPGLSPEEGFRSADENLPIGNAGIFLTVIS